MNSIPSSQSSPSQDSSKSPVNKGPMASGDDAAKRQPATVLVRGETVSDLGTHSPPGGSTPKGKTSQSSENQSSEKQSSEKQSAKPVSAVKVKMQNRLPALDDDGDIGIQKDHVITRDGKADLAFTGTLLASAAPPSAPHGKWDEYRIYTTNGGKHVFSKVSRNVLADEHDTHEAEVFDPSPSSMPSQLLRTARDLTRSHPLTWNEAAVAFFGYDPLAKALYKKLDGQFEERIS